jgi:hypothetical protein
MRKLSSPSKGERRLVFLERKASKKALIIVPIIKPNTK